MPILIELSPSEQKLCELIAQLRYESARGAGVRDQRIDTSGQMLDLNGFGAELAFCKAFNLYPDFTVGPRHGGYDVKTHKGTTVDVKCTKYENGHLVATKHKEKGQSDIYVLVVGEMPRYKIVGYLEEDLLLSESNLKDLGKGMGYAVSQDKLKPF